MSAKPSSPTIIIVKKHGGDHDDEHGGAWKVAYADFVTAMMALFIVLWLLSASEKVQKAVGGYFQDPTGKGRQTGSTNAGFGETLTLNRQDLQTLKEKLQQVLHQMPAFQNLQNQIRMTITAEGLRIDLLETERGLFFERGDPKPSEAGTDLLRVLGNQLANLPNKIAIEGHTDATPYGRPDYGNWELSSDRANAARRILIESGLKDGRISQVRGFADQRPLLKSDPTNPSNRRISIIVRNEGLDQQEEKFAEAPAAATQTATAGSSPATSEPKTQSGLVPAAPTVSTAESAKKTTNHP